MSEAASFLARLRSHGAARLEAVSFRRNRRTLWSVTGGGRRLNLHDGYRHAPEHVVRAFAIIVRTARRRSPEFGKATATVRQWPGITEALARIHGEDRANGRTLRRVRCAGTARQRSHVQQLFHRFNRSRFSAGLPDDIPLRLSTRMTSRLGHMAVGRTSPERTVREIALNLRLLHPARREALEETLLHEMAHAAAWLFDGHAGHGEPWKAWARRAGCEPVRCVGEARRR